MQKINFQDGQKISSAKVTIDGVDYLVTPSYYEGATPLTSLIMNTLQTYIENAINQNADNIGGENYDATETYAVGDIVKYNGQLYICITAVATAEAFDSQKWQSISLLQTLGKKAGSTIDLSINSSTYVMTLDLKNEEGTTISTDSIDLPLESMVVNGTYDSTNKKIVLTLQSGSTIDVPVGDLVSGLQSEITSSNKLSADLVDDTSSTNKFVTSSDKTTWNSKVGTTDYATSSVGGVIVVGSNAVSINSNDGKLYCEARQYSNYTGAGQNIFISKGTLENVITGKGLLDNSSLKTINNSSLVGSGDLSLQETLVSGTNIKTINNESILGSGNITIQGGGGTSDYDSLSNRPQINSTTLTGNKSASDLGLEASANKVTSLSSSSTDTQYPSAKCVYDLVGNIENLLSQI